MNFWRKHWWFDILLGATGALLLDLAFRNTLLTGNVSIFFLAVVTASAALGALAITPIAIILALTPGPRLKSLMKHHVDMIRHAMSWTVFANLFTVLIGILGISTNSSSITQHPIGVAALIAEFSALLAMGRLVWFFVALLRVNGADRSSELLT